MTKTADGVNIQRRSFVVLEENWGLGSTCITYVTRSWSRKTQVFSKCFTEAKSWSKTVHRKQNASVEAKYSFIPTPENQWLILKSNKIYLYLWIFATEDLAFYNLIKVLSSQLGSGWRFIECILNASWLMIHDFGKRRSQPDSTVYSAAMMPKFRNLLEKVRTLQYSYYLVQVVAVRQTQC